MLYQNCIFSFHNSIHVGFYQRSYSIVRSLRANVFSGREKASDRFSNYYPDLIDLLSCIIDLFSCIIDLLSCLIDLLSHLIDLLSCITVPSYVLQILRGSLVTFVWCNSPTTSSQWVGMLQKLTGDHRSHNTSSRRKTQHESRVRTL